MRALTSGDLIYIVLAVRWTLLLSLAAFVGGSIGGVLVALARTSEFRWLRFLAIGYIKLFQGTPLLMQLFLAFFEYAQKLADGAPFNREDARTFVRRTLQDTYLK